MGQIQVAACFGPIGQLVERAIELTGMSEGELLGSQRRPHARVRQAVMFVGCQLGLSTAMIGRALRNRDHTSVINARRVIEGLLAGGDEEMIALVARLMERGRELSLPGLEFGHDLRGLLGDIEERVAGGDAGLDRLVRQATALRWALQALGETAKDPPAPRPLKPSPPPRPVAGGFKPWPEVGGRRCGTCSRLWLEPRPKCECDAALV